MSIEKQIRETQTFKSLDKLRQELTLMRTIRKQIEHGVIVSGNRGFDWYKSTNELSGYALCIVQEIIEKQNASG